VLSIQKRPTELVEILDVHNLTIPQLKPVLKTWDMEKSSIICLGKVFAMPTVSQTQDSKSSTYILKNTLHF
jgi:hypothetical protein